MPVIAPRLLLADRIWIAVALLHREHPDREDFSRDEIRRKLDESGLSEGTNRQSVNAHLKQHMVANATPSSSKGYRMLLEPRRGYLRLFRPGDPVDPQRQRSRRFKQTPSYDDLPPEHRSLLDWYESWSKERKVPPPTDYEDDPLIRLIGSGKHIWADEHADEYVENLRREDI